MRHIRISAVVAFSALSLLGQSSGGDVVDLAQRAVQLQQAGSFAEAAAAYRKLLALNPQDVATHVNLGVVLVALGRFDDALAEYTAAEQLLPGDPRIALNLALAYEKSGRLKEAVSGFEALHKVSPEDDKVTMLLADAYLQTGDNRRVIELLQPLEARKLDDLGVSYMLGMALLRTGRSEQSQVFLDRILRNGDTAEARFLLGTRMFEAGDFPAAVKQLASAAELNPRLPQLQSRYGQALLNSGDPDLAAQAFRKELATDSADYDANLGLGQILVARKQFDESLPLLQTATRIRPDAPQPKLSLAECLSGQGDFEKARGYAESAIRQMPKSVNAHQTLAQIYGRLNLTNSALNERKTAQQLASASDPGPQTNELAPQFELADALSGKKVSLQDFRGKSPVVLVFGSYSCPNFRGSSDALISMYKRYGARVQFLLVYIREAHSSEDWQSSRNVREDIAIAPATTFAEKQDHAAMCSRKLHLPFPAVVDTMDGAVEQLYRAWPSRVFIVGENGRVSYSSRLTELDFRPEEMEAVLRGVNGRRP